MRTLTALVSLALVACAGCGDLESAANTYPTVHNPALIVTDQNTWMTADYSIGRDNCVRFLADNRSITVCGTYTIEEFQHGAR